MRFARGKFFFPHVVFLLVAGVTSCPVGLCQMTQLRMLGGVDVNAAASTDPTANFFLDASLDKTITGSKPSPGSLLWASGYVRLASITQPGAISGLSNIATYVSPLAASTPSTIVQSAEAEFTIEGRLYGGESAKAKASTNAIHLIASGGIITPLSPNQSNPVPYLVTQALYNFYNNSSATGLGALAYQAITTACGATFSSSTPCYVAYIPQDRARFYRNWSVGFRLKDYYTDDGTKYLFPSVGTLSVGQNEYVTGGMMRGLVLHGGGNFLVPTGGAGKFAGSLWLFGAIDTNLTHQNPSSQQFLLQPAPSTVTATSASVAVIPVAAQNRDRYRFGVALDISKIISLIAK